MFKKLINIGVVLVATLILFEKLVIGEWRYKESRLSGQKQLSAAYILNEDGTVTGEGWMINTRDRHVIANQGFARSHWDSDSTSWLMQRNINYLSIQAGNTQITVLLPIMIGPVCIVKVIWFDRQAGPDHGGLYESVSCPVMKEGDTHPF